jgi:hypothetical protein
LLSPRCRPQKKKVLKASERFKFTFDWDAKEDTSRDLNPLYQNLHGGWALPPSASAGVFSPWAAASFLTAWPSS